jgi:hypothetical protein
VERVPLLVRELAPWFGARRLRSNRRGVTRVAPDDTPDRELTGGFNFASSTGPITFNAGDEFSITNGNAAGGTTHTMSFSPRGTGAAFTDIIQPGQKFKYSGRGIASVKADSTDANLVGQRGPAGSVYGGQTGPSSAGGAGTAVTVQHDFAYASNLAPNAGASQQMSGLGVDLQITPLKSGNILCVINEQYDIADSGDSVESQLSYGLVSGGVPALHAAVAGTQVNAYVGSTWTGATGAQFEPLVGVLPLTVGEAYWVDVANLVSVVGDHIYVGQCTLVELPS